MKLNKNNLREIAKKYRNSISESQRLLISKQIYYNLNKISHFIESEEILMYASLPKEVDTLGLIKDLLNTGKKIYCPRTEGDKMYFYRINSLNDLKEGNFHVLEPDKSNDTLLRMNATKSYCMIIPGLMFDVSGNRLGYGKGFYDKFLFTNQQLYNITSIALSFDEMVKEHIPSDIYDVRINYIVTENKIIVP